MLGTIIVLHGLVVPVATTVVDAGVGRAVHVPGVIRNATVRSGRHSVDGLGQVGGSFENDLLRKPVRVSRVPGYEFA